MLQTKLNLLKHMKTGSRSPWAYVPEREVAETAAGPGGLAAAHFEVELAGIVGAGDVERVAAEVLEADAARREVVEAREPSIVLVVALARAARGAEYLGHLHAAPLERVALARLHGQGRSERGRQRSEVQRMQLTHAAGAVRMSACRQNAGHHQRARVLLSRLLPS